MDFIMVSCSQVRLKWMNITFPSLSRNPLVDWNSLLDSLQRGYQVDSVCAHLGTLTLVRDRSGSQIAKWEWKTKAPDLSPSLPSLPQVAIHFQGQGQCLMFHQCFLSFMGLDKTCRSCQAVCSWGRLGETWDSQTLGEVDEATTQTTIECKDVDHCTH